MINELLANNETINTDEEGEYDDWLELFNDSDIAIDLSNHFLTDKIDNLTKWQFPDSGAVLEPSQFMLVWCDEDQEQGLLHTNFKLSSGGEFVALVLPDGVTIIDSITFPSQSEDISYGRYGVDNSEWIYMSPSPSGYNEVLATSKEILFPMNFELKNIYPNPFNSSFNIDLNIEKDNTDISVQLFSITGTEVLSRPVRYLNKGDHNILIDMNAGVASGSYILRINSDQNSLSRKLLYLK